MKTVYNISSTQSISEFRSNIRLTLAVVGIMTALICSLILFNGQNSKHAFANWSRVAKSSKAISVSIDLRNADVVSAIRPVKW